MKSNLLTQNIRMEGESIPMPNEKLPKIIVFDGPNGSGKSTITKLAKIIEPYINADVMHVYVYY